MENAEAMDEREWLAQRLQENRGHLRAVAYKLLGSPSDADDAVQETWLRLHRADVGQVENLTAWLTTVVARVCLDMLRARDRREKLAGAPEPHVARRFGTTPEQETLSGNSVGVALLVVLETLSPAERVAFVLHDVLATSFEEIAAVLGRSPAAARQLASRARRRVQGRPPRRAKRLSQERQIVDAFLAALRNGDFEGLIAVLDPGVVVRVHETGTVREIRGAREWTKNAITRSRLAQSAEAALVSGSIGAIFAPRGRLYSVLRFKIAGGRIVEADVFRDPARLRELDLAVFEDRGR
jgi:RNA polymerase sigma factor (sigma-70 family)